MNEQGSSGVMLMSAILDRIRGIEKVISNSDIEAALEASSKWHRCGSSILQRLFPNHQNQTS
jgi:hypothetical protein